MNSSTSALAKIKVISFDSDGTLWDFQSAMRLALELTLQQLRQIVRNGIRRSKRSLPRGVGAVTHWVPPRTVRYQELE